MELDDERAMKGYTIHKQPNQITQIRTHTFKVQSQSGNGEYVVTNGSGSWNCSCPDHTYRLVKCKHIWAVEFSLTLKDQVAKNRIIQPITVTTCLFCHSSNLKKFGVRHNKNGDIRRFLCASCHRTFSVNIGFEKMKHNPQGITAAMQLYFSGESLRNTARSLRLLGVAVSHQTIHNWIAKYTELMKKYLDETTPNVSDVWRADELWIKVKGDMKFLFALMDDETRFWIAQEVADTKLTHDARSLFHRGREVAGKKPLILITDGLRAYQDAFMKEYWTQRLPKSRHIRHITIRGDKNNNKMERLNGEVRDREKVMRGLKRPDTPILKGYQIFHNFVRPHEALEGKTPAEACGIEIKGKNKWVTLIQNASRKTSR
jgi:transposase-like protein